MHSNDAPPSATAFGDQPNRLSRMSLFNPHFSPDLYCRHSVPAAPHQVGLGEGTVTRSLGDALSFWIPFRLPGQIDGQRTQSLLQPCAHLPGLSGRLH